MEKQMKTDEEECIVVTVIEGETKLVSN